jgi:hypothetical protein
MDLSQRRSAIIVVECFIQNLGIQSITWFELYFRTIQGLLGPKKELWDVLQLVEKCTNEAQDITSSIRDLPTVK